ncbi:MAG: class IV adenylate cyclase [Anaerolineaceae bacterium]|jgi:adenylate cyclase class 2|nr:MAG: class IV adenylate cyclase [Anaerolineaceae bacterium]
MNGRETEVKFFVNDLQKIELRLRKLKAQLIHPRAHEINLRFDDENGSLRRSSKVLRLRRDVETKLTFKGPSEEREGGVMSRREIEFSVGDFKGAKQFLEALGFMPVVFYEKYRATYEMNGVHIMLDELPYGEFVEIEGEDINMLMETAKALGLNWNAMVKAGYHALFDRVAEKFGLVSSQLSFEALESVRITADDMNIVPAD